jgi:hypothetical protein
MDDESAAASNSLRIALLAAANHSLPQLFRENNLHPIKF